MPPRCWRAPPSRPRRCGPYRPAPTCCSWAALRATSACTGGCSPRPGAPPRSGRGWAPPRCGSGSSRAGLRSEGAARSGTGAGRAGHRRCRLSRAGGTGPEGGSGVRGEGRRPRALPAQAGRIRIRIARRDPGRIKVAVVKSTTAEGAEGTNKFANAVDHELGGVRGILLVSGGHSIHMVVSFSDVDRATAVLRQAVNENDDEGLAAQLIEGVTRLADVDPGRGGDIGGGGQEGGGVTDPAIGKKAGEVLSTVKLVLLIVGIAVALPFVLVALGIA